MLFEKYMMLEADAVAAQIREQFGEGAVTRDGLIEAARGPLENAGKALAAAEWFEDVYDDDLTHDNYILQKDEDDDFADAPNNLYAHRFIDSLVRDERGNPDGLRSAINWNESSSVAVVHFYEKGGDHEPDWHALDLGA